jgi:hypothetical protein
MIGIELVFSPRLKHPSHTDGMMIEAPWHGGEIRTISIGEVVRWGKLSREGDFCTYVVAEVDGKAYSIDGKSRSREEEKEIRRVCRKFKAAWPRGRGWGFAITMEDERSAPPMRTLTHGEQSPHVRAAERRQD